MWKRMSLCCPCSSSFLFCDCLVPGRTWLKFSLLVHWLRLSAFRSYQLSCAKFYFSFLINSLSKDKSCALKRGLWFCCWFFFFLLDLLLSSSVLGRSWESSSESATGWHGKKKKTSSSNSSVSSVSETYGINTSMGGAVERSLSAAWNLWSRAVCRGAGASCRGKVSEPLAPVAFSWRQVLDLCTGLQGPCTTCIVLGPVYCGEGGTSFRLRHFAEIEHEFSGVSSSCYRPEVLFQDMKMYFDSAGKPFSTQLTPWDESSLLLGSRLFVDFGTRWNNYHRSKVNMFLRLLFFISLGIIDFLLIDKKYPAASPASAQRNRNCLTGQPYLNSDMKRKTNVCFSSSRCWYTN